MDIESLEPCAAWTPDCQGKQDYDGRVISISTRYWPGPSGGGSMVFDTATGAFSTVPYGARPSAKAAIVLNHGEPDQYGYGDSVELASQDFEAETEGEVKRLVEEWVREKVRAIAAALPGILNPS